MKTAIKTGRPTVIRMDTVRKLERAFEDGFSVQNACRVSGISRSTFYKTLQENEQFSDKITRSQDYYTEKARNNVAKAIDAGDMVTSRWYLERKAPKEFSLRHIVVHSDDMAPERPYDDAFAALRQIADLLTGLK